MQKRSVINSPGVQELKRKRQKILKRKIIFYASILLFLIIGLSLSSRINKFNINEIKVSGNKIVDTQLIEQIVRDNLNDNYFYIFPKTNFLIYPKNKISNELSTKYKRLKNVSINITNIRTLEINVNEYDGKYLYCGNMVAELDSKSAQKCYFMDRDGYIFDEAPYFSGDIYFKFFGKVNDLDMPIGNYYKNDNFSKLISFKDYVEKMNLKPVSIYINNENEVYMNLSKAGGSQINPTIIFKINSDYEKMSENLEAALTSGVLKTKLKDNYINLSYIDLRYGNKVYYKFK